MYLAKDGTLFVDSNATYWKLIEAQDKAKLFRAQTDATHIVGISDFRNQKRTTKLIRLEGALHPDKVLSDFDIPKNPKVYAANTFFDYGEKIEINGRVYQNFNSGLSGSGVKAPDGFIGPDYDPVYDNYFWFDGQCKWFFVAEDDMKGALRWGANNGVIWYFSNLAVYHFLERINGQRIQEYIECYISNLVCPWLSGVTIPKGAKRIANQQVYRAKNAGTTGVVSPAGTGTAITDGTVVWEWIHAQVGQYSPWAPGQTVAIGDRRTNAGNIYQATVATVTSGTAPTHKLGAVNGWEYLVPVHSANGATWYMLDTQTDRHTFRPADSHDAYASSFLRLVSAWVTMENKQAWLDIVPSGYTISNLQILKEVAYANLATCVKQYTDRAPLTTYVAGDYRVVNGNVMLATVGGLSSAASTLPNANTITDGAVNWVYQYPAIQNLITTFQGELHTNGSIVWDWCYLQDNCENYSGLHEFSKLLGLIGDPLESYYSSIAANLAEAISRLFSIPDNAWRFADKATEISDAFYPDIMANVFPELHQVPVGISKASIADKYDAGWEFAGRAYPAWWGRHPDTLASLVVAYVAARFRQEPLKAAEAVEYAMAHHLRQGAPQLGTFIVTDFAYALAIRSLITDSLGTQGELSLWKGQARGNLEFVEPGVFDVGTPAGRLRRLYMTEFIDVKESAPPLVTPIAGTAQIFLDSTTHQLGIKFSDGSVKYVQLSP